MSLPPIRLFMVDDSAFMRQLISKALENDKHIQIVGRARNGQEALARIPLVKPHVVTMDVEMPVMDGLETLAKLMESNPLPVVMLSSLTTEGAETTLKALELGAVDFIPKPRKKEDFAGLAQDMTAKIRLAATVSVRAKRPLPLDSALSSPDFSVSKTSITSGEFEAVVIGTSTGGPSALQKVVPRLPRDFPAAVLIVQHMPKGFTRALAERLNQMSQLSIKEAENGDPVASGRVLVAPAGKQMYLERRQGITRIRLSDEASVPTLFKPSFDVTLLSTADIFGKKTMGVIMTGMGNDGVRGLRKIEELGGKNLAEAEQTCVVFGMPKAAIQAGVIHEVQPVEYLAHRIFSIVKK